MANFKSKLCGIGFVIVLGVAALTDTPRTWAQTNVSADRLKSALLVSLLSHVTWPEDENLQSITLGYTSEDAIIEQLLVSQDRIKVKGLPLKLVHVDTVENLNADQLQVLYWSKGQDNLHGVASTIRRTGTLLVTDESRELRDVMINLLLRENQTIGFEVNRTNLVFESLKLSRDALLLGGTELDVAELFRELEYDLSAMREDLFKKEESLAALEMRQANLSQDLNEKINQIGLREETIREKEQGIDRLSEQFNMLEQELKRKQEQLDKAFNELNDKQKVLSVKQEELALASKEISDKEIKVYKLNQEIAFRNQTLGQQLSQIEKQQQQIGSQQDWLKLIVGFLLLISAFAVVLLNLNRAKKQANARLQLAKDRAQKYLDIAGSIIMLIGFDGRIILVNHRGGEVLGADAKDLVNRNLINDFVPEKYMQEHWQTFTAIQNGELSERDVFDSVVRSLTDKDLNIRWSGAVVTDESNEKIGILLSGEDYTERLIIEAQRNRAREEAELANRSKTQFLSNMSHELRTPLNAIMGFAQLLQSEENLTNTQQENIEIINRSGNHLLELINDVLDLAKIESGHMKLNLSRFKPASMLDEITAMFSVRANNKNLDLQLELDLNRHTAIQADEGKTRQVLINLVGNAIKFTQRGGILIYARFIQDHALKLDSQQLLELVVKDTGVGINKREHQKIFKVFEQASEALNHSGGTGLGLAICNQYASLMGGDIELESEPGQGASFTLRIPVEVCDNIPESKNDYSNLNKVLKPDASQLQVLVVDDIDSNRSLIQQQLEMFDIRVAEADSGEAAIQSVASSTPDLIFMDKVMPGMGGLEAIGKLKQDPRTKAVPIVCVSANVFESDRHEIFEKGADGFIPKPFELGDLIREIDRLANVTLHYEKAVTDRPKVECVEERYSALFHSLNEQDIKQLSSATSIDSMKLAISIIGDRDAMLAIELWEGIEELGEGPFMESFLKFASLEEHTV